MKFPKVETLIILAFFGIVAIWTVTKCSSKRSELARHAKDDDQDERIKRDSVAKVKPLPKPQPSPANPNAVVQTPQNQPVPVQTVPQPPAPAPQSQKLPVLGKAAPQVQTAAPAPAPAAAAPAAATQYSTLYVTIDGLKMRKEPNLKGTLVSKLKLYEPVYFLNQKTEKTEEISLGLEKVTDHWVKVRTKSGKEGWVFGAGVHYYKMKRKGVLE